MKRILYLLIFAQIISSYKNSSTSQQESTAIYKIQSILDSTFMAHPETKGISVHIIAPNIGFTWAGAIGNADTTDRKLTPDLPGNIASNTKTYVAAAILRLAELGQLNIHQSIAGIISPKTEQLLRKTGYAVDSITIAHLATNTSGIYDFVNIEKYQNYTLTHLDYRWTRDEQIELAMTAGPPRWPQGAKFEYSETGFLILTEIIEHFTHEPFHSAMRKLLKFDALGLNNTWFVLQENAPANSPPLIEQTASRYQSNSLTLDFSFDAFGGGGLAATPRDLAHFSQQLFASNVFDKPETRELLFTTIPTADSIPPSYSFGLMITDVAGHKAYGHGGFWGTQVKYIPDLNISVAVFVLESDAWEVYNGLIEEVVRVLEEE